jgi:hypothetical protein
LERETSLRSNIGSFRGRPNRRPLFFLEQPPLKFPDSAVALVDELDRLVPERVPEAGDSMESIQRQAGKRELVLFLKNWRDAFKRETIRRAGSR